MDGINGLIEQYPTSAVAYAARAGMEEERGLLTLAEYDYTQAIMRDPNNTDYIIQRIEVYRKQKKYEQAKRDAALLRKMGIAYRGENWELRVESWELRNFLRELGILETLES